MSSPRLPFDVELAWGTAPTPNKDEAPHPASFFRLFVAFLADLGLAALGFFLLAAGTSRWQLSWSWLQAFAMAVAGVGLLAGWVEVACLWFFHRTVGMYLVGVRFEKPVKLKKAVALWLVMLVAAPLCGLPLVLGGQGSRWLEKVAGSGLKREDPHAGA